MATKKVSKIEKTADQLKIQAKQIHDTTLVTSDNLVDDSIVVLERWQKLMAKALKGGTVIFGKQQEMVLESLETLKEQNLHGGVRLRKLLGIKAPSFLKAVEEVSKPAAAKVQAIKDTSVMAKEMAKVGLKKAKKAVKGATPNKQKTTKIVKVTASEDALLDAPAKNKKVKTVATKKKATIKKANTKVAKRAVAKKVVVKKEITKDSLTKIEGIGPKIEQLLNAANIYSFKVLAAVDVKTLRTILDNAGPRYKMHNPKTWKQQAKLAATGKWDKLAVLQKELKGGVKVKK